MAKAQDSQRWAGQSGFDCGIGDVVRLLYDGPSIVLRTQELVEDGLACGVGRLLRSDVRPHGPGREPVLQGVGHLSQCGSDVADYADEYFTVEGRKRVHHPCCQGAAG